MSLKVIGAGYGRTGTASLKIALEMIGLARCYHMSEVFENPSHVAYWQAARRGESVPWQALLEDYQAVVDWPACTFYKDLMVAYPDAKVILSIRDPESWYESAKATVYKMNFLKPVAPLRSAVEMANGLWQDTFGDKFEDKAYAISVFNDHIEDVKSTVPPEKLLVYNVKEGWEALSAFLGVPVPNEPFPRVNSSAETLAVFAQIEEPV